MTLFLLHALFGITIVLAPEAGIQGNEITLDEIATVRDASPADLARLSAIEISYAPTPGYSRVIRTREVLEKISGACPDLNVTFAGATACRATPKTEIVKSAAITATVRAAIARALSGRDATIEAASPILDIEAPLHARELELRPVVRDTEAKPGPWNVAVQIWVDGSLFQTVWASMNVEIFEQLPVLTRSVRRGEVLAVDAFEPRRTRVTSTSAGAPLTHAMIPGALALHDLAAGSAVFERDVERARLVKRGDVIELSIKKGSVTARASAIATQDGRLGDRIRITTGEKKRELQALVVGQGSVQVELGGQS